MTVLTEPLCSGARAAMQRGDYLTAYGELEPELSRENPDAETLFLALLCLARSGAADEALRLYEASKHRLPNREDVESFAARLIKDSFLAETDCARRAALGIQARDRYLGIFKLTRGYFPGINAATLSLLIGDVESAKSHAEEVLQICKFSNPSDYWVAATVAEAQILRSDLDAAAVALIEAKRLAGNNNSLLGTTYRQLKIICETQGINPELLRPITPPTVIHYCGHLLDGIGSTPGVQLSDLPELRSQIRDRLAVLNVGVAFGSLACGSDILVAEEVMARGGELHIILPFSEEQFLKLSVRPGGPEWEQRFRTVMNGATSVRYIVDDAHTDPGPLFAAASQLAMGLAILRSDQLCTSPVQVAIWNGISHESAAGTSADISRWTKRLLRSEVISISPALSRRPASSAPAATRWELCALICADVRNFSKIPEQNLPLFLNRWGATLSQLCHEFGDDILFKNTWGDALFVVIRSPLVAAKFSLKLAHAVPEELAAQLAMPNQLGVRVSVHFGPVYAQHDPVLGTTNYYGPHVNKVARLEPCTPPGCSYCSEEFAAALALTAPTKYRCEYAGEQELPKGFGRFRMYHLR